MEIVYIKQEYKDNPITALLSTWKYKHGTKGAELADELQVVNKNIFTKNVSDAFSSKEFEVNSDVMEQMLKKYKSADISIVNLEQFN